jgi:hypothetical protein
MRRHSLLLAIRLPRKLPMTKRMTSPAGSSRFCMPSAIPAPSWVVFPLMNEV